MCVCEFFSCLVQLHQHNESVLSSQDDLEACQEGPAALVAVVIEKQVTAGMPFETHHLSIILNHLTNLEQMYC